MYLNLILVALVRKSIFKNGVGDHFGVGPLAKTPAYFRGAGFLIFFIKGL